MAAIWIRRHRLRRRREQSRRTRTPSECRLRIAKWRAPLAARQFKARTLPERRAQTRPARLASRGSTRPRCGWILGAKSYKLAGDAARGTGGIGAGGFGVPSFKGTSGRPARDLDGRAVGIFRNGIPKPRDHLRQSRPGGNMLARAPLNEIRVGPKGHSGVLLLLRPSDPYRGVLTI